MQYLVSHSWPWIKKAWISSRIREGKEVYFFVAKFTWAWSTFPGFREKNEACLSKMEAAFSGRELARKQSWFTSPCEQARKWKRNEREMETGKRDTYPSTSLIYVFFSIVPERFASRVISNLPPLHNGNAYRFNKPRHGQKWNWIGVSQMLDFVSSSFVQPWRANACNVGSIVLYTL